MGKNKQKTKKLTRGYSFLKIGIIIGILIGVGYFVFVSMIPVNADFPVFAAPSNIYIKTVSTQDGSAFTSQSIKGGKTGGAPSGIHYPTITVKEGNLVALHFINEDSGTVNFNHQHDLNIDEFNVHSNVLGKFQAQTITFVADKVGEFDYYSSIHPEMRGKIVVK